MKFSSHNIFSEIRDSENYFIVNLLSGNADILSPSEAEQIRSVKNTGILPTDKNFLAELISKGYLVLPENEESLFRQKYLDFLDNRDTDEIQIFYVPGYSCNFACSYCYQDQYSNPAPQNDKEVIDAFIKYINLNFQGRKKYITVFGGEPLLAGQKHKQKIEYLVEKATLSGLPLCFVTNGYNLSEYVTILKKGNIREIQVTLDGTAEYHDKRRFLKGGGSTFEKIVAGIDACLSGNLPVNLRMVVDRENIENLPELATFAKEKGWTGNRLFKTQLGRNYELHHCQDKRAQLFDRLAMYEKIYEMALKEPAILEFHKPALSISRYLSENGLLPDPLFDACPACKTEWAFDYTGYIFPCTATVGKAEESLGTFYPEIKANADRIEEWEKRDVTSIPECISCNQMLACGGGCGSVAKNSSGKISSPDCRPVKELMELGFSLYIEKN